MRSSFGKFFSAIHVNFGGYKPEQSPVRLARADSDCPVSPDGTRAGLRFRRSEIIWLAGKILWNAEHLRAGVSGLAGETIFRCADCGDYRAGAVLVVRFEGLWTEVTMWEVYGLALVSEMKTRAALGALNELELDVLYARAKTKLWEKLELLRAVPEVRISEFGTRRRHSFLWQEYVIEVMRVALGASLSGTSNTFLAYKHDLEAMGTNAHELPMAVAGYQWDEAHQSHTA
jgi:nicotinate phosphoribosyltransferase